MRIAFVCVRNAGRSQMAAAFAERERDERGLDWEIVSGGTDPADSVHGEVVEAMEAVGVDLTDRTPRAVDERDLAACDYVVTMGCSTRSLSPDVGVREWALDDPDGKSPGAVAAIRDEVERRVAALFDEVEGVED